MKTFARLGIVLIFCVYLEQCLGLMCYFCQDTSSAEKKNACQTWIRTMKYYRRQYNKDGTYSTDKYIKNCTNYANEPEENVFCMIARIESRGEIRSFIRDCSNGRNFFSEDFDSRIRGKVLGDNQTACFYTGTSDLACVTLCRDGHFCNGPLSGAGHIQPSVITSLFAMAIIFLCCFRLTD